MQKINTQTMEKEAEAIGQFIKAERQRQGLNRLTLAGLVGKCEAQIRNTEEQTIKTELRNILLSLNQLGYTLVVAPIHKNVENQPQENAQHQ